MKTDILGRCVRCRQMVDAVGFCKCNGKYIKHKDQLGCYVLKVSGIEDWITTLVPIGEEGEKLMVKDEKTGATFLIKRVF